MTLALIAVSLLGIDQASANTAPECQSGPVAIFSETFSRGGNQGAWSLSGGGVIESRGGHPTAYLHDSYIDTFAPMAHTEWGGKSPFAGNFRARGVVGLAADFKIFSASLTAQERPMSLMLVSDAGTPREPSDDIFVFYVGPDNIPLPGKGWVPYQFDVPAHSLTLPFPHSQIEGEPGWVVTQGDVFTPAKDPDAAWNIVMEDVDQVIFWFHDPRYFAFIQSWNVGMDNPSILSCSDVWTAE
jgi:hypothetical protein